MYVFLTPTLTHTKSYIHTRLTEPMESTIHIHGDIDYLYIVNFSKDVPDILYCNQAWDIDRKQNYFELVKSLCILDKNLPLDKEIKDAEED